MGAICVLPHQGAELHFALTACGSSYTASSINTLKSAVLFTPDGDVLKFHVFTDRRETFEKWREQLPARYRHRIRLYFYHISEEAKSLTFIKEKETRSLPCTTQRLFYTEGLQHLDHVVHVDTDMIFLHDIKTLHDKGFAEMNNSHVTTMSQCGPRDRQNTWYNKDVYTRMPFYPPVGLQAGIMWMNLTRMRRIGFQQLWRESYEKYNAELYLYDQDILNALFATKPELVKMLTTCDWHYWYAYCQSEVYCTPREVYVLHGVADSFHKARCYPFNTVWGVFEKFSLGQDIRSHLLDPLLKALGNQTQESQNQFCGKCINTPTEALVGGLRTLT
ncbi:glucoside xylosyltransferase 1-like [Lingula anatina]|uniref:UDP-D-xylose:beta-D-glucoside alpha-1,3-D-xylosyltransferase n=1 Tax=Lingula anatina TaxID=7574 RepID=A0A1S3K5L3_LINAN|nr:glucoside xylosyltransferase 1-like [Lingula anatina]|eukprot:XP_013417546.1 glucoside xylosyltransferase 1-like [Lingula anatina]